ncbi:MAG TPA: sulfatase [Thermoanaerobaculia bacterium]|nr:sulfatase [Thermoanaerobaculia bacterium]
MSTNLVAADGRRSPRAGLALAAWGLALAASAGCGGGATDGEPRGRAGSAAGGYNVVVVLSDALRASNLPFYGYPRETAPVLGALTAESVIFERHLAAYPSTPTSVSQMLTGRLMPPLLMDHSFALAPVHAIEDDLLVLPRVLKAVGYRTGIVTSHPWFNERARVLEFFDRRALVEPRPGEAYAPFEALLKPAERFLDEAPEPFFLYVHSMDTHGPFRFHPGFDGFRGDPAFPEVYNAYDSEILYTDHWLGWLVDELRGRGLLERTVFAFTSDHGEELGEMGPEFWNRSHGYTVRRVQLHVPLLLRLPGGRFGGTRVGEMTNHLDLAPTLLRLAAPGERLEPYRIDGRDLSGRLLAGWADAGEGVTTYAYSWRYWGLHTGDLELHYDQWRDAAALYRTTPAPLNYPSSLPAEEPKTEVRLAAGLAQVRSRRTRELLALPPSHEALASISIGVPTHVVAAREGSPTFEREPDDGLWFQNTVLLLEAGSGEDPGPLTLATPWAPGRYRVWVRLARSGVDSGVANRFRLRIGGPRAEVVALDGADAGSDGLLDAGVHAIGSVFQVEVSEPRGGVAIAGFHLALQGAGEEAPASDEELEERLRALGYVD